MSTGIFIKEATEMDIALIQQLNSKVWPQTYKSILSKEQIDYMLDMMYTTESLLTQMKKGIQFIIIHDDNIPVGFASFYKIDKNTFKLDKIYVLPTQQGKGTGKFVVDYISNFIMNEGASALQLQVNKQNLKAKCFYEKIGFNVIEEADFDIGNGYFMNDFIMEKKTTDLSKYRK